MSSRERRGLVPFEIAAVVAIAVVPLPEPLPRALPLLVVASVSRWVRGRTWAEVAGGPAAYAGIGAIVGLVALVLALVAGTPITETLTGQPVQWSTFPIVRGSSQQLFAVAVFVGVAAIAAELALRGWIVERALELGHSRVLAVLVGAFAEALLVDGDLAARIGAGAFGGGLGWIYVAAGRSTLAPMSARLAFTLGALALEALRVVG